MGLIHNQPQHTVVRGFGDGNGPHVDAVIPQDLGDFSQLSGTINNVYAARDELLAKYPDRRMTVVDTLSISAPQTILILKAHELYRQGKSMDEVAQNVDRILVLKSAHVLMSGTPKEVFARADELLSAGLDVPQVTELADELKAAGMEIPCGILTIDELVAALEPLLKRKEA